MSFPVMLNRVVIKADGTAVNPVKAKREYQIEPGVIFVRNDGWTLGAPAHLENVAFNMWRDEWTRKYRFTHGRWEAVPTQ